MVSDTLLYFCPIAHSASLVCSGAGVCVAGVEAAMVSEIFVREEGIYDFKNLLLRAMSCFWKRGVAGGLPPVYA